jgi:hypothetical protein
VGLLPGIDRQAVALIVFPAFVVQVIVGIFAADDELRHHLAGGRADLLHQPAGRRRRTGIFFVVFAVFTAFMLASALPKRALAAVLAVAVPRFLIAGVADLAGSQALSQAGAALGFLLAAVALYTAFALLMEDSRGREVLPIGRLAMALHATHGNLAMQLRDIERQAGVRRTL